MLTSALSDPWIAAGAAIFLWWFSTGIILWRVKQADRQGPDAHLWSTILGLPLLIFGMAGLRETMGDVSAPGAWLAFVSALAVWGWIELAFLSGTVSGPNRAPCPPFTPGWERFVRAVLTILWHELALLAALAVILHMAHDAPNATGLWTFVILFFARISAKLNLFFGVPRIHTEFLPRPVAHLASHFRLAPMNAVFPLSVSVLSFAVYCWLERLWQADTPGQTLGFTLLAVLTALALLEHWFMVLPLPDQKLWRWMLPAPKSAAGGETAAHPLPSTARLKETRHGF